MKEFEVELRALLSKKQFDDLYKHFSSLTKGDINDMTTWAFLTKDVNIKIKNLISKKKAKIVLKNGAEYKQQTNEFELGINPQDVEKAIAFITALGFKKYIPSFQKRVDFVVNDITISLKHETHWGYQIEVEKIVQQEKDIPQAKEKLHQFLDQFHLVPMTEEETRALTNKALKKYDIELI